MTASTADRPTAADALLRPDGVDLDAHHRAYGPRPSGRDGLVESLRAAGLTGRGGAGFPVWRKLAAVRDASGRSPIVVANGAEGEPVSAKDRTLLHTRPHLVLDGLQLAAEAVGAARAVVYAQGDPSRLREAVHRRRTDRVPVTVLGATPGFLSGEESAVVSAVSGGPALPRDKRVPVWRSGVAGRPTAVQNVETLAHLALVARFGPEAFRRAGTADDPGTMLVTVSQGPRMRVGQVAHGTPLRRLVDPAAGPALVGGFHGAWLAPEEIEVATLTRGALVPFGATTGAGVLRQPGRDVCGLADTARIVGWLAGQSAGQCGPCRNGLPALAAAMTRLAAGGGRTAGRAAEAYAELVVGRGACHHPDGTVRLVRSALRVFAADVDAHRADRCLAGEPSPGGAR